jgi:hypothetical protein
LTAVVVASISWMMLARAANSTARLSTGYNPVVT